jgi:AraC family transcriptional regulator, carnitine catabolism transcriptional activator
MGAIYGDRITCSGGIAGLDMMVALITRDHGHELGAAVSDWFLHTQVREGVRPQRMDLRFRSGVTDDSLLKVLRAMETHLRKPLSRERLAKIAAVSLRQLERLFRSQMGRGVHEHYLALRIGHVGQPLRGYRPPSQFRCLDLACGVSRTSTQSPDVGTSSGR